MKFQECEQSISQLLVNIFHMINASLKQGFRSNVLVSDRERTVLARAFEYLKTLPDEMRDHIDFDLISSLLSYQAGTDEELHSSSSFHREVARWLSNQLPMDFTIENEVYGLQTRVLPLDIALKYKGEFVAFIEVDGPSHYSKIEDDRLLLKKSGQLKSFLYQFNFPNVLFERISVSDWRENQSFRSELLERLKGKVQHDQMDSFPAKPLKPLKRKTQQRKPIQTLL